jgi:hypothetical protein
LRCWQLCALGSARRKTRSYSKNFGRPERSSGKSGTNRHVRLENQPPLSVQRVPSTNLATSSLIRASLRATCPLSGWIALESVCFPGSSASLGQNLTRPSSPVVALDPHGSRKHLYERQANHSLGRCETRMQLVRVRPANSV